MKSAFVFLMALGAGACSNSTEPNANVSVQVDSAVYHLRPDRNAYAITLSATIVNNGDHEVYLSRFCPTFTLARPAGYAGRLEFGQYACAAVGGAAPPTLTLSPGATHTESFKLIGSEQPQATPKITLNELIGPAAFGFVVSTDLKRFKSAMSAPFLLAPPA